MNKIIPIIIALSLTGCAAIEPDSVSIEQDHVSHAIQHFGSHPTNYGYDSLNLVVHWQGDRFYADIAEGMVLEGRDGKCYGGLWGPREVFTARAGFNIWNR